MQLGKPRRRLHVTPRPIVLAGSGRSVDPADGRVSATPDEAEAASPAATAAPAGPTPDRVRRVDAR